MARLADAVGIRAAALGDVPALDAIDAAAWDTSSTPGPLPMSGTFPGRLPLAGTLVAVGPSRAIVGYVTLADACVADDAFEAIVRSLAVHPDHRGRGIGGALLAAIHDLARTRGCLRVRLFVLGSNAPAIALYRKAGYRQLVVFPGEFEIEGHRVDDVVMGLTL